MKTYKTKEECIEVNGQHAWYSLPKSSISCLVYHPDGHCSWNDPQEKCYHCPAKRTYTRTQREIYNWVDENGNEIVEPTYLSTTINITDGDSTTTIGGASGTTVFYNDRITPPPNF